MGSHLCSLLFKLVLISEEITYRYLALADLVKTLGDKIKQAAAHEKKELLANGIDHPIIDNIIKLIDTNIDETLKQFELIK